MKKRKLKGYVLSTIYLGILIVMVVSITFLSQSLLNSNINNDDYNYSTSVFESDEEKPTNLETTEKVEKTISLPYSSEKVTVAKNFYSQEDSVENQEKALIYYENTYMPNTGILYESDEKFDVMAILDGKVKKIKENAKLGNMLSVEHENNITTVYYALGEIKVNVGDTVSQNQIIATSGSSKLQTDKTETLLFEIYIDGVLKNPNTLFNKTISEITESP